MNWWGICVVFIFLPALCVVFLVGIGRDDADKMPRPGDISDEITKWRDHPYAVLEESPPVFYDWEQGDLI